MDKTGSIKNEVEFSFEDTKAHYLRTDDMIKIYYSWWRYSYFVVIIYKNGNFDYEHYASYDVKELKKGLKNPLTDKYNYNCGFLKDWCYIAIFFAQI